LFDQSVSAVLSTSLSDPPGEMTDSDHHLVIAKVKKRLSVSKEDAQKFHVDRLNCKKLSKMKNRKKYEIKI